MTEVCPICNNIIDSEEESCSSCGYHFLGSTQSFKPLTVEAADIRPSPRPKNNQAQLRVVRGPQIEAVFALEEEESIIGRSPRCEIFLNDMTVSREHAKVTSSSDGHIIEDLSSYNGVWVNNANKDKATLQVGDIIQIGAFCLIYQNE